MNRLHRFFRLSAQRDEIETRLLAQEYRALILDDLVDDGTSHELRSVRIDTGVTVDKKNMPNTHS